jgi:hypothetical protein
VGEQQLQAIVAVRAAWDMDFPSAPFLSTPACLDAFNDAQQVYRPDGLGLPTAGIWWSPPGLLAGLSRPGIVASADDQFRHLAQAGVRQLICLEQQLAPVLAGAAEFRIQLSHFPIPDMAAPTLAQAVEFCRLAERANASGEGVAFHCHGGLGRTGTAIAAVLVWYGLSSEQAIQYVRRSRPRAIQSAAQTAFLSTFAEHIRDLPRPAVPIHPFAQPRRTPMSLDKALVQAQSDIPECVASGYVDMSTGMLLGVKTVDSHPSEVLDLVAAATGDLFRGATLSRSNACLIAAEGLKVARRTTSSRLWCSPPI